MAEELPHLPDLPNAGYSTTREKALSDVVMQFMREIERDRARLLTVVLEGRDKWRRVGKDVWGWLKVDDDLLDAVFAYFELQACRPAMQVRLLAAQRQPDVWRMLMAEATPDIEAQRERIFLMRKWLPGHHGIQ